MRPPARTSTSGLLLLCGLALLAAACASPRDEEASTDSPRSDAGANASTASTPAAHATSTSPSLSAADSSLITVYKSPTCGCCKNWVDHMRQHGFRAAVTDVADVSPVKKTHGVSDDLASCHTALIGGYVVEGHVPAEDVRRLLRERPDIVGIAVPGMPAGSPGMEVGIVEKYDVIAFGKDGSRRVFARH